MLRSDVLPIAEELLSILGPGCQDIRIAGSVRRGKAEVHDLEFVVLPIFGLDLFEGSAGSYSGLDMAIESAIRLGKLRWDDQVKRNGPKMKRLIHPPTGLIVELYIADERNFGNQMVIRTGCKEFSAVLMTPKRHGGLMPDDMRQIDGYLWRTPPFKERHIVPCRTEIDYFEALGVDWIEPAMRTPETAPRMWREGR